MLRIACSQRSSRYCDGISRRSFLQVGMAGMGGLTLPQLLQAKQASANVSAKKRDTAVILIWLDRPRPKARHRWLRARGSSIVGMKKALWRTKGFWKINRVLSKKALTVQRRSAAALPRNRSERLWPDMGFFSLRKLENQHLSGTIRPIRRAVNVTRLQHNASQDVAKFGPTEWASRAAGFVSLNPPATPKTVVG